MNAPQVSTNTENPPKTTDDSVDPRYQALIDYKALNGLVINESDAMRKMTMEELSTALGVDRTTLYNWMKRAGFWDAVNARRKEISPAARLAKVHEVWFLKAAKGEFQHMQLWLANFDPNFRMPTEKVEHDMGNGLADLIAMAKSQQRLEERKVIDVDASNG